MTRRSKNSPLTLCSLLLAIGCGLTPIVGSFGAQDIKASAGTAKSELWIETDLPDGARWRYGARTRDYDLPGFVDLEFSHDGNLLAARDHRQNVRILNLKTKRQQSIARSQYALDLSFSPDDKAIITVARKKASVWLVEDGSLVREIDVFGSLVGASPIDSTITIAGLAKAWVYSWPMPGDKKEIRPEISKGVVRPKGLSYDGSFCIYSNGYRQELRDLHRGLSRPLKIKRRPNRIGISPNGLLMMSFAHAEPLMEIWDLRNPSELYFPVRENARSIDAAFSFDSRFIYSVNQDKEVVIWDMLTRQVATRLKGHLDRIHSVAAAPELLCLATSTSGTRDRTIIFWDAKKVLFPVIELEPEFDLDGIWEMLGSDNVDRSLAATNQLYHHLLVDDDLAAALLEKSGVSPGSSSATLRDLIQQLDHPKFETREAATWQLQRRVHSSRDLLTKALESCGSEAEIRIRRVLQSQSGKPSHTAADRRDHRIVLAMELAATKAATDALEVIAQSHKSQDIRNEARLALVRLTAG